MNRTILGAWNSKALPSCSYEIISAKTFFRTSDGVYGQIITILLSFRTMIMILVITIVGNSSHSNVYSRHPSS